MDDLIKLLDKDLEYITHTVDADTIHIYVKSVKDNVKCPYCGEYSSKTHSKYKRTFQDLPIQGKKVILTISNRKMFCNNLDCKNKTFSEKFDFIDDKSKKTKRLEAEIIRLSVNMSSIAASKYLKENIVNVSKSTICTLLKKRNS